MKRSIIKRISLYLAFFQLFSTGALADNNNYKLEKKVSAFDTQNIYTKQYGASQKVFKYKYDELIDDPYIWDEVQKYFPISDFNNEEEAKFFYQKYFNRLAFLGCGYAVAADFVFQLFEGREDEFYERFHFPMYKEVDGKIDFNYELFMLKFYHFSKIDKSGEKEAIIKSFAKELYEFQLEAYLKERKNKDKKKDITEMTDEEWEQMKKDEEEKNKVIREYKEKIANAENEQPLTVIPKNGNFGYIHQFLRQFGITINIYSINNFDDPHVGDIVASYMFKLHLLDENGNIIADSENDYSHYFYITDITSDGKIIVSNNGLMYQFNPNEADSNEIIRLELSK